MQLRSDLATISPLWLSFLNCDVTSLVFAFNVCRCRINGQKCRFQNEVYHFNGFFLKNNWSVIFGAKLEKISVRIEFRNFASDARSEVVSVSDNWNSRTQNIRNRRIREKLRFVKQFRLQNFVVQGPSDVILSWRWFKFTLVVNSFWVKRVEYIFRPYSIIKLDYQSCK